MLSIVIKLVIAFLLTGVLGVWWFAGFDYWVAMVLSPLVGPFFVWWAARVSEKLADRATVDLGYGVFLAEVFTGRAPARGPSSSRITGLRSPWLRAVVSGGVCRRSERFSAPDQCDRVNFSVAWSRAALPPCEREGRRGGSLASPELTVPATGGARIR